MRSITTWISAFLAAASAVLVAQEEADRPVGEVTPEMARRSVPKSWVGAGDAAGQVSGSVGRSLSGFELPQLVPTPQELHAGEGFVELGSASAYRLSFVFPGEASRLTLLEKEVRKRLARDGYQAGSDDSSAARVVFSLDAWHVPVQREKYRQRLETIDHPEGYVLGVEQVDGKDYIIILGKSERALWRAVPTLVQLVTTEQGELSLPEVEIIDYPHMDQRALLVDVGGQGYMVGPARWEFEQWREFVDWMVDHKFNEIWFEIIGSGRLMGNLDMAKGEWIGFPLELESYPQLVCRDRPIRRWDAARQQVVEDTYTAPNVRKEFLRELIDYVQARGMKAVVFVGYDYFANQLPYVLNVPANDPSHPEANRVYDQLLREIVERYDNAQGVVFHTIENKNVPPEMVDHVVRRAHEGRAIVKSINPRMDVGILNDYLEWRPREEFDRYSAGLPSDMYQVYSPHVAPLDKAWLRIHRDVFRYELYTQYAWNHAVYIFPERVQREIQSNLVNGYRNVIAQAWYAGVFKMNFMTMAEMSWNATGRPLDRFWDSALVSVFGEAAAPKMREAFAHTRFDRRLDIVGRMLMRDEPEGRFQFWDMYRLTVIDTLSDDFLAEMEDDARLSLQAASAALDLVPAGEARAMVEETVTSAERRLYLARSARHFLRARAMAAENPRQALAEMDKCLAEGKRLIAAATKLGIEYPMAVHDDDVVTVYRRFMETLQE